MLHLPPWWVMPLTLLGLQPNVCVVCVWSRATLQLLWYFYDLEVSTVGTVVDLDIVKGEQLTVVGDLHGQWEDLMTVFAMNGLPSQKNRVQRRALLLLCDIRSAHLPFLLCALAAFANQPWRRLHHSVPLQW